MYDVRWMKFDTSSLYYSSNTPPLLFDRVHNNNVVFTLSLPRPQLLQLATEEVNSPPSLTHRQSRVE